MIEPEASALAPRNKANTGATDNGSLLSVIDRTEFVDDTSQVRHSGNTESERKSAWQRLFEERGR
jgi:hypothetical protein